MRLIESGGRLAMAAAACLLLPGAASTQEGPRLDVYGFVMMDMGYQAGQNDPAWFDVVRPTKLPAFEEEFGEDGRTYFSVRQTRFGVRGFIPTPLGEMRTTFEFELFGTGVDAGQTTIRLRHAYGELGQFGAGQTWSPFMDIDVFPNSIEYWGPNGMAFFRNVQVRWMPLQGDTRVTVALERPGASADGGEYADRIELQSLVPRFQLPDFSAEARRATSWGYLELAGIVREMRWDDNTLDGFVLSGSEVGWGLNLSSNVRFSTGTAKLSIVYGEGIQNYMNDAPVDVAAQSQPDDPLTPFTGEALPVLGLVAFYDHTWSDRFTSSIGYSMLEVGNTDLQTPDTFKRGDYALVNLLYSPVEDMMVGGEVQYGRRENLSDAFTSDDVRFQVSFRYNFSSSIGGTQ